MEIPNQQLKQAQKSFRLNSEFISVTGNWIQVVRWMSQLRGSVQRERSSSGTEYPGALVFWGRTERRESTGQRWRLEIGEHGVTEAKRR